MKRHILPAFLALICFLAIASFADSGNWPHEIIVNDAEISVFQPQLESFKNNHLTARSAISIKTPTVKEDMFCTLWFSADTIIDKSNRVVYFKNVKISKLSFPGVPEKVKNNLKAIIDDKFLRYITQIELDRFLPMLETLSDKDSSVKTTLQQEKIRNDVPQLFFSKEPAILVSIDGEPKLTKITDKLMRVINRGY